MLRNSLSDGRSLRFFNNNNFISNYSNLILIVITFKEYLVGASISFIGRIFNHFTHSVLKFSNFLV